MCLHKLKQYCWIQHLISVSGRQITPQHVISIAEFDWTISLSVVKAQIRKTVNQPQLTPPNLKKHNGNWQITKGMFQAMAQKIFILVYGWNKPMWITLTKYDYLAYRLQKLINGPTSSMQQVATLKDAIPSAVRKFSVFMKHEEIILFWKEPPPLRLP